MDALSLSLVALDKRQGCLPPRYSRGLASLQGSADGVHQTARLVKVLRGDDDDLPARGVQAIQPIAVLPDLQRCTVPHPVALGSEPALGKARSALARKQPR